MRKLIGSSAVNSATEENKKRKKSLLKIGILALLAFLVWIFSTIAWFSMNKSVTGSGMSISSYVDSYEIAVTGNQVMHSSMFPKADNTYYMGTPASNGVVVKSDGSTESLSSYYKTGGGLNQQGIMLEFTGTSEQADAELEPGGSGVIQFYVIPGSNGDINIDFNLNFRGFIEKEVTVEGVKQTNLVEISTLTVANSGLTTEAIAERKEGLGYLKGHIFFFNEKNTSANPAYLYSDPITDGIYHFSKEDAEAGKLYPVTIYWVWPKTLGQLLLKDNTSGKRSGIPIVEDSDYSVIEEGETVRTDKGLILDMVKSRNNNGCIFNYPTEITTAMIESPTTGDNFRTLSRGYNNADEIIGNNVRYMLLEISS